MTIRRSVTAAACLLMAAAGIARAATLYECDLRTRIHNGWVSPKMAFVFEDDGRAKVIDGITLAFLDGPAEAKVTRRGDNLRIKMYLSFVEGWTNPAAFDYAINKLHKSPIPIKLVSNEGKRVRFSWELKGLKFRDGTSIGRVVYKGSVDKKTLHIRMESIVPSNVGRYFTEGQCQKIK